MLIAISGIGPHQELGVHCRGQRQTEKDKKQGGDQYQPLAKRCSLYNEVRHRPTVQDPREEKKTVETVTNNEALADVLGGRAEPFDMSEGATATFPLKKMAFEYEPAQLTY